MTMTLPEAPATTEPEHHAGTMTVIPSVGDPIVHQWDTRELATIKEAEALFDRHAVLYHGLATTVEDRPGGLDSGDVIREFRPEIAAHARTMIYVQPQGG